MSLVHVSMHEMNEDVEYGEEDERREEEMGIGDEESKDGDGDGDDDELLNQSTKCCV